MLEVKKSYADKMEKEAVFDLIKEKRGILILDLDHTLFQVTMRPISLENPEIVTWNFDDELRHSGRLREDRIYWFRLPSSSPDSSSTPPFFLRLRPGLFDFLAAVSPLFELYVFTQGTSEYALRVLSGIDPDGALFGQPRRLIAREIDSTTGAMVRKQLSRVFPSEEGLVLIVDDRDDVWTDGGENLIKIAPFLPFPDRERETKIANLCLPNNSSNYDQLIDFQFYYLKILITDLHSELFLSDEDGEEEEKEVGKGTNGRIKDFRELLKMKKNQLFRKIKFINNLKFNQIFNNYGGNVVDHPHGDRDEEVIDIGGRVSPWFLLFSISTLFCPNPENFEFNRISQIGPNSMWELSPPPDDPDEADLFADLS
jgi:FCP1-like phosphatase family protein